MWPVIRYSPEMPPAYLGSDEVVREDRKRFLRERGVFSAMTKD